MIRFFNSAFVTRPVFLLLLFVAINLPLVLLGVPVTLPELKFMVLGERLQEGAAMYRDVFDTTGPLAAMIFWVIDLLDGRSLFMYRLVAAFLLLFQALNLNFIFNRQQVFAQKTYLPALFYILGGSFFFEFDTLSPVLLGQTFLVYSLRYLVIVSKEGSNNQKLFKAGFFIGLAALSYLPFSFFLVVAYFAVAFFASNTFRSFLLLLTGFFFPFAVVATYYLYNGALDNFQEYYLSAEGLFSFNLLLPLTDLLKLLSLPLLLIMGGIFIAASANQGLVFQQKMQQLMFVWFWVAVIMLLASPEISVLSFIYFLPVLAYYSFYLFRPGARWWIPEVIFLTLFALIIAVRYAVPLQIDQYLNINTSTLQLKTDEKYKKIVNGQLLVLGSDFQYYAYNYAASPYLNWKLAQQHFGHLDTYEAVFAIQENIVQSPPEFIVDEVNLMPQLVYKLPLVFGRYEPAGAEGLYRLKR
ncbi:hypothetical protein [Adhaeribacter terreus]|uniref:Glycosyltransferase RgtA/B/C/D-like domain-containing protein n=1 Tax=Adhaeribacter terreus TaxID=529703 RepID=A0ABW0EA67_9BACT